VSAFICGCRICWAAQQNVEHADEAVTQVFRVIRYDAAATQIQRAARPLLMERFGRDVLGSSERSQHREGNTGGCRWAA